MGGMMGTAGGDLDCPVDRAGRGPAGDRRRRGRPGPDRPPPSRIAAGPRRGTAWPAGGPCSPADALCERGNQPRGLPAGQSRAGGLTHRPAGPHPAAEVAAVAQATGPLARPWRARKMVHREPGAARVRAAGQAHAAGFWLEYASMAWMNAEAGFAITAGVLAPSIALVGFGLDSVIECAPRPRTQRLAWLVVVLPRSSSR